MPTMFKVSVLIATMVSAATLAAGQCAAAGARDACQLLKAETVAKVIGKPVASLDYGGTCAYFPPEPGAATPKQIVAKMRSGEVDIYLEVTPTWQGGKQAATDAVAEAKSSLHAVPGIADAAWVSTSVSDHALVRKADVLVQINMALIPGMPTLMQKRDIAGLRQRFEPMAREVAASL